MIAQALQRIEMACWDFPGASNVGAVCSEGARQFVRSHDPVLRPEVHAGPRPLKAPDFGFGLRSRRQPDSYAEPAS